MPPKRCDTSLKTKLQIINECERGRNYRDIAKEFSISKSAIGNIYKKRFELQSSDQATTVKRARQAKYPAIEDACVEWIKSVRAKNLPISGPLLMEKAKYFAERLGINDFAASEGWLARFKLRHGIVFKTVVGEAAAVTEDQISDWKENVLPTLLRGFDENDIFNLDETGLFWRLMPNKTMLFKNDSCSGGKKSKERITHLLGVNLSGTEKLPVLAIGKSLKPRCFKHVQVLPVQYAANKKAWMVSAEWELYLKAMDRKFRSQNRQVLFVVDNCSAHPVVSGLLNIRVVYLPPNTTAKTQPMDQGVIQNFKCFYRRALLQKSLRSIDNDEELEVSLLDSLFEVRRAWDSVKVETIANCFKHAGFIKSDASLEPDVVVNENDDYDEINDEEWNKLLELGKISDGLSYEDYISSDENILTTGVLSEEEIVKNMKKKFADKESETPITISSDDEEDCDESNYSPCLPTSKEADNALQTLRHYILASENGHSVLVEFIKVENFICENSAFKKQLKIDDFFTK